jgi:hypothetical protein
VVQAKHNDNRSDADHENKSRQNQSGAEEGPLEPIEVLSGDDHKNRL